jgi:adenylate kinase family enzyme
MTDWRRIHIIGGAGSGKTTLARSLAAHRSAPVYDLDQVAYEGGAGAKRSLSARLMDVQRIAAEPNWVTEGIFLWWTDELLRAADVVIWLDLPWHSAARRVVIRHLRASLAGTNRHRGIRRLLRFLRATWRYYRSKSTPLAPDDDAATSRAATMEALAEHGTKVIHCRRPADVRNAMRVLCSAEVREVRG